VLWLYLTRCTDLLTRPQRLLHFAPERALGARLRRVHKGGYLSGDILRGAAMRTMDIIGTGLPTQSFDAILVSHVLEHVEDDLAGMREIKRLLAPDGMAILQHPIDYAREETLELPDVRTPERRQAIYHHHDHKRLYGRDFSKRLALAGLATNHIHYTGFTSEAEQDRFRLRETLPGDYRTSDLYICRRET
jgi:SAM-dependent methyltransferase